MWTVPSLTRYATLVIQQVHYPPFPTSPIFRFLCQSNPRGHTRPFRCISAHHSRAAVIQRPVCCSQELPTLLLPLLRTLRVDQASAHFVVTVLGSTQANSSPPCPLLMCIEIGVPDASPKRYKSPQGFLWGNISPDCATLIQRIAEGLRKRAVSLGHPLHTLNKIHRIFWRRSYRVSETLC
jgi:hypothetical protein